MLKLPISITWSPTSQFFFSDAALNYIQILHSELIAPLIKAVQELYNRIVGIEAAQNSQAREIASIKAENQNLKLENDPRHGGPD